MSYATNSTEAVPPSPQATLDIVAKRGERWSWGPALAKREPKKAVARSAEANRLGACTVPYSSSSVLICIHIDE